MRGGTFRIRMKTNSNSPTFTPENKAVIQRLTGTKYRNTKNRMIPPKINTSKGTASIENILVNWFDDYLIRLNLNDFYTSAAIQKRSRRSHFIILICKLCCTHRSQR